MNSCTIFAGGEFVSQRCVDFDFVKDSYVIAADRGYDLCRRLGITPALVIGDFDSVEDMPLNAAVKRFPKEKDDTDLMLAVKEGLERGCGCFSIYGATGGRLDHMVGNIQTLAYILSKGASGAIISDCETVRLLSSGSYKFPKRDNFSLSLFAYSDSVDGLTISGCRYCVLRCTLSNNFPMGVSNEITQELADISFESGTLLVVESDLSQNFRI